MKKTGFIDFDDAVASDELSEIIEVLLSFATAMLQAGAAAFRVRDRMGVIGNGLGLDSLAVQFAIDSVTVSAHRGREHATLVREIAPPGINVSRINALHRLAGAARHGLTPHELLTKIESIKATSSRYSIAQTIPAAVVACGAFAFFNGGNVQEMVGAAIGGGIAQYLRVLLSRRCFNQYATVALCALVASGVYWLITMVSITAGFGEAHHVSGFISSMLFMSPGFPMIVALSDLLQHLALPAVSRLAYSMVILLAAASGVFAVTVLVGFSVAAPAPLIEHSLPLRLVLRGILSFGGGCGFAILFNSSPRTVLVGGLLALVANELRLALHDAGMTLSLATSFGALGLGLLAALARRHTSGHYNALMAPWLVMMVPGIYGVETVVQLNQGNVVEALSLGTLCVFCMGALAAGLAAARFISDRRWAIES